MTRNLRPRVSHPFRILPLIALSATVLAPQARGQGMLITSPSAIPNGQILNIDTGTTGLPGTFGYPAIPGVTFVETAASTANGPYDVSEFPVNLGGGQFSFLGHQYLSNVSGVAGYSSDEIDFANPVTAVGGYVQRVGSGNGYATSITLLAYNGNTLVGGPFTVGNLPSFLSSSPLFYGISNPGGITRMVWEPGDGTMTAQGGFTGGFIGIGQITVGGLAAVPEPASLASLAVGLAGLAAWRLRRRALAAA